MEAIIRQIYAQWVIAKEQARQECESRSLHNIAEKYRRCNMFKGTEHTIEELAAVFTSRQGLEFCIRYHFPNIATFRLFKAGRGEVRHIHRCRGNHAKEPGTGNTYRSDECNGKLRRMQAARDCAVARRKIRRERIEMGCRFRDGFCRLQCD